MKKYYSPWPNSPSSTGEPRGTGNDFFYNRSRHHRLNEEQKTNNMTKENIAQVAHEVNKAFCESIGDTSQPAWNDAPEWQQRSAINGVQFHLENPDAPPSASHENWLKEKQADGWVYGPVKDPQKKEHPCCVPYDELPVEQRSKDFLFKQVIHSLKGFLN